jgi:hypothetical protein
VRTYGPGSKYFDDLVVRPLPSYTTTTRVITYTYECIASLKRTERDNLYGPTGADYCAGEEFTDTYGCISMSRGRTLKFGGASG